jgi:hypothetical protein
MIIGIDYILIDRQCAAATNIGQDCAIGIDRQTQSRAGRMPPRG